MRPLSRRQFLHDLVGMGAVGAVLLGSGEVAYRIRQLTWPRAPRTRLVLTGSVVTFDPVHPLIERGVVYIDERGIIEAVLPAGAPPPAGYGGAAHVETGGVIYPGLIDLHNHPFYDLRSLWTPQQTTPYVSRDQWRRDAVYLRDIGSPSAPLLSYWYHAAQAALKYVEIKALVSGVTTLQGLDPYVALGRQVPMEGRLLRHVEQERLPQGQLAAANYVFLPEVPDPFALFRQTMANGTAIIYHLAEGTDPALQRDFEDLYQRGCIGPRFIGIHATALTAEQFRRWAGLGGTLVWSPLSNLWLYGQTTDVAAAHAAGLRICLGPDWSVSGSKNLLGELKVADLWNQHQLNGLFTDQQLCEMVTAHPADAIALGNRIGRIQAGLHADLAVMAPRTADPYRNLIESTERDVLLVVADGRVCYGMSELTRAARTVNRESLTVGGIDRDVSLPDPTAATSVLSWSDVDTTLNRVRGAEILRDMLPWSPHGELPLLDTLAPDEPYFRALEAASIPGAALNGLRAYYAVAATSDTASKRVAVRPWHDPVADARTGSGRAILSAD